MPNYFILVFILFKKCNIHNEEKKMCKMLKDLYGKTSSEILEKYGNDKEYFTDIVDIAKNIGIELGSADFTKLEQTDEFKGKGNILGAVRVKGDKLQISYHNRFHQDKKLSPEVTKSNLWKRQRFTIAHEIAHCCLHMDPETARNHIEYRTELMNNNDPNERAANIFAGELLMPTKTLMKILSAFDKTISLKFLGALFGVSRNVVKGRLTHLKDLGMFSELIYMEDTVIYEFIA